MRFFWNRGESDLEREIAHHLHQLAEEYERQGHSRKEALLLAKREFGGSEQVKEQCRDERRWAWMTGLRQDIVFGLRMMRKTPVITLAAVLSLALGIGGTAAIASLMDVVLWRDLPVPNPEQLTLVHWQGHGFPREMADSASGSMLREEGWDVADFFSYASYRQLRESISGQASLAAFTHPEEASVSFAGRATVAQARPVSGNFLSTLQLQPLLGRLLSDHDDTAAAPAAVVLTHRFWVRTLGSDPGVIGRVMSIDSKPYVIAGVLSPRFSGLAPGDSVDLYTPLHHSLSVSRRQAAGSDFDDNRYWGFALLAQRSPGVTSASLKPAMDAAFASSWSKQPKDRSRAPAIRLDEGGRGLGFLRREFRNPLLVLAGLVGLLLVIACTNIANLLLARAVARQREVAMRVSLGCSQARLVRQFLTESALLAFLGGVASIGVAYATANLLGQFLTARETLPIAVSLDFRILALVGAITAVALLVFGLFPAWQGSRLSSVGAALKGGPGLTAWHARRSGRLLVAAQMAMSIVLVMAAVIFTRNLLAVQSADPGFDRRNLILFGIRPGTSGYDKSRLPRFYFDLEQRLAATQGVAAAGLAAFRPMNIGGWWDGVHLIGQTESYQVTINGVTPSYLPVYSTRMIAGRNLTWPEINNGAKVAVISEDLARKMGGLGVLGHRLAFQGGPPGEKPPEFDIVGIAPVIAATSIKERPYALWLPFEKDKPDATVVLRTFQPPQAVLPAIRQAMAETDRNLPMVDVITMEEQISKVLVRERMFATLCSGFGILALVLSVVGLYGVIAYSTSRRRGEIGVRLALGALPSDVVSMVLREGLGMAVIGMLLGVPVVWAGASYLEKELFQMKPLEPLSLLLSLSILLVAALLAVGIPAIRAAALQPAETLRQE